MKDIAFIIPSKMGTVGAAYKHKQVISGKLAQDKLFEMMIRL